MVNIRETLAELSAVRYKLEGLANSEDLPDDLEMSLMIAISNVNDLVDELEDYYE